MLLILVIVIFISSQAVLGDTITGSGTTNYIPKFNGSASITNSNIYESGGNIGIGTTSPIKKLHVVSSGELAIFQSTSSNADTYIRVGSATGLQTIGVDSDNIPYLYSGGAYKIRTGGIERIRIDSNGNVGIGTTSPVGKLDLVSTGELALFRSDSSNADTYIRIGSATGLQTIGVDSDNIPYIWTNVAYKIRTGAQERVRIDSNGNVGIGTTNPTKKLTVKGNILVQRASDGTSCLELGEGLDYSEGFDLTQSTKNQPGSVLVIDPENPGKLTLSTQSYDTKVAGITAGAKGLGSGVRLGVDQFDCDVALAGRVYCNVDATKYEVRPGDLLTTSNTQGYAMKAMDYEKARGATLGKAMEGLEKGKKGQILVLVTLQ